MDTLKLSNILATDRYPYQAALPLGDGQHLVIRYRPAPENAGEKATAFLKEKLAGLGFDPDAALASVQGIVPEGDALAAFVSAWEALGPNAGEKVAEAVRLAGGYELSLLLAPALAVKDAAGREHPLEEAADAEVCASLPADLKRAIHRLASEATPPPQALLFLGASPRS